MPKKKKTKHAKALPTKTGAVSVECDGDGTVDLRALERELSRALNAPEYKYWASVGAWTLDEAVLLLVRQNPYHLQFYPEDWARLGMPAVVVRTFLEPSFGTKRRLKPADVIKRADECKVHVPPELRKAVMAPSLKGVSTRGTITSRRARRISLDQWRPSRDLYEKAETIAEAHWQSDDARNWDHAQMTDWLEEYSPDGKTFPFINKLVKRNSLLRHIAKVARKLGKRVRGDPKKV